VRELGIAAVFRVPTLKWARSGMRVLKPGLEGKRAMEQTYMLTQHSLAGGLALAAATLAPVGASAAAPQSPITAVVAADGD